MVNMKIKEKIKQKKISVKKIILLLAGLAACLVILVLTVNQYVINASKSGILTPEQAKEQKADCILVLGAGVNPETKIPSNVLEDRLLQGIELYKAGAAKKLLMSGDHGREDYDEVNVMKDFAISRGVPSEDIFMDHAGFSTYESMYRARDVFEVESVIIVTQNYHLYRAIYIARGLGLEAYGVPSDPRTYGGRLYRDVREILARNKDFVTSIIKPKPKYLGDAIPVSGDGNVTND